MPERTEKCTYGNVTITVKRRTIGSDKHRDRVLTALRTPADDMTERNYQHFFAQAVTQTVQVEGLKGYSLPSLGSTPDEFRASYAAFNELDGPLGDEWFEVLKKVNEPPGPPVLLPANELGEEETKN
jgi:hypothetical protein